MIKSVDPSILQKKSEKQENYLYFDCENLQESTRNIPEIASKIFVKGHALKQLWREANDIVLHDTSIYPYPIDYISFVGFKIDKLILALDRLKQANIGVETVFLDIKTKDEFALVSDLVHMKNTLKYLTLNIFNIYPKVVDDLEIFKLKEFSFNLRNMPVFNFNFKLLTKISGKPKIFINQFDKLKTAVLKMSFNNAKLEVIEKNEISRGKLICFRSLHISYDLGSLNFKEEKVAKKNIEFTIGNEEDMGRGKDTEWWVLHNQLKENWAAVSLRNLDYLYVNLHDHNQMKHFRYLMDNNGDYCETSEDELMGFSRLRISDERKDSNEGVHNYDNYYNTGDTSNEKSVMNQTKNNSKESLFLKLISSAKKVHLDIVADFPSKNKYQAIFNELHGSAVFDILIKNEANTLDHQIKVLQMFKGKQIKSIKLFKDKEDISAIHSEQIVDAVISLITPEMLEKNDDGDINLQKNYNKSYIQSISLSLNCWDHCFKILQRVPLLKYLRKLTLSWSPSKDHELVEAERNEFISQYKKYFDNLHTFSTHELQEPVRLS